MKIKTFVFNPFYENTMVVSSESGEALIIDPGCYEKYEVEEIKEYITIEGFKVVGIVNTHCHIDHVLGNSLMKRIFNTTLKIPIHEQEIFKAQEAYAPTWGIQNYQPAEIDAFIEEHQTLRVGEVEFTLIEVPGHSPGHMVFYSENEKVLIGGDVLFKESIGRTDLPGGDHAQLIQGIQEKVYQLPEDTIVYPGHGPTTTIGYEKANNPFVKG